MSHTKNFMSKQQPSGNRMQKPKPFCQALGAYLVFAVLLLSGSSLAAQTLYSIGDPTDDEQQYVEYINRARANPNAEAQRMKNITDANVLSAYSYFGVDLNLMVSQFASLSVAPPLSINTKLTAAARLHSQDMLVYGYQGHTDHNGNTLATRLAGQNYSFNSAAENVGAYTFYPLYGHAGMEVDWGGDSSTGGMQSPAGHRLNIHNAGLNEIGVGVINGTNANVSPTIGPQLVTQDFGTPNSTTTYITGTAYYDFNSSGFYDSGEGLGGVTVTVAGSNYYAVTSTSGGYSVPVPANGTYTVTFSAANLQNTSYQAAVSGGNNVKVDYTPTYTPPIVSATGTALGGQAGNYTFNKVGGAVGYDMEASALSTFSTTDGAEAGLVQMTASISSGYSAIANDTAHSGGASFHLAHVQPTNQSLTWNHTLRPTANSALTFWSRLGYATSAQFAVAQVTTDGGAHWQDVWTQAGTNSSGQVSFFQQNVSLSAYAGMNLQIRFLYRFGSGTYYPQSSTGIGFYIDDISVSNATELTSTNITTAGNGSFSFTPPAIGTYSLAVRAKLPGRTLAWGPSTLISVTSMSSNPTPPAPAIMQSPASGSTLTSASASFTWNSGTGVSQYALWISNAPNTYDLYAAVVAGTSQSVTVPTDGRTIYVNLWSMVNGVWQNNSYTYNTLDNKAKMNSPAGGSTLPSASTTFNWSAGTGVSQYALWVGSAPGTYDLYAKAVGSSRTDTVNLPEDGRRIYVRIYSMMNGVWKFNGYTYTAFTSGTDPKAALTSPSNGSTLPSGSVTFNWSTGSGASQYAIWAGSAPDTYDLYAAVVTGTSRTVTLPTDGRPVYVNFWSMINGVWQANKYLFTAATQGSAPKALITSPANGSILTSGTLALNWNAGSAATQYALWVGSAPNTYDLYAGVEGTNLSKTLQLPLDGRRLYVTLWSLINGVWQPVSYYYDTTQ
jgi:uncharacterized protein YkwD